MPTTTGTLLFSRMYSIDSIVSGDFGGVHPNNTLTLNNLTQVSSTEFDITTQLVDNNGNSEFNGSDQVIARFPGDAVDTTLTRVRTDFISPSNGSGFGSGVDYVLLEDSVGNQYIIFSSSFDVSRISGGSLTLTEQGDAPGNMAVGKIICFAAETLIECPNGDRLVETLKKGDMVLTADGTATRILWIGCTSLSSDALHENSKHRPVTIRKDALCPGVPAKDLRVSRQHRILLRNKIALRMFGTSEVLVAAHLLVGLPGVSIDSECERVDYFHILLEKHEVLIANGSECESLYFGEYVKTTITEESYKEVLGLLPMHPKLSTQKLIRRTPKAKKVKQLILRLLKNKIAACEPVLESMAA